VNKSYLEHLDSPLILNAPFTDSSLNNFINFNTKTKQKYTYLIIFSQVLIPCIRISERITSIYKIDKKQKFLGRGLRKTWGGASEWWDCFHLIIRFTYMYVIWGWGHGNLSSHEKASATEFSVSRLKN